MPHKTPYYANPCYRVFAIQLKLNEVPLRIAYFVLSENRSCPFLSLVCYIHYTKLNKLKLDKFALKGTE